MMGRMRKNHDRRGTVLSMVMVLVTVMLYSGVFVQSAGAAARTASVSGNWSSPATWGGAAVPTASDTVTINNSITVTVDTTAACSTLTTVDTGALNISGTNTLTVSGLTTMARPSSNATNFTINVGAGQFTTGSLTMSATTTTRNNIITISTGTLTINGAITTGTTGCQFTFAGAGTMNIGGSFTSTPALTTFTGSTVNYTAAGAQTARAATYYNLTLSGSGVKTFATTPTVNGVLSLEGTATVVATSGVVTYGANATLQYDTATARTATAEEWITPFAATGGVIIANTGTITLNAAKVFNASVPLTINSGATLATGNFQLTFGGNFANSGTFTAGTSPIVIANTMGTQSIAGFTTTGLVSMTKTAGTATFIGNVNGGAFTLNGSGGTLDLGAGLTHTFTGAWTRSNGTLLGNSSTLNIGGTTTNTAGTFTAGTSTVNYNGAAAQTIANVTYNNLILSGSLVKSMPAGTSVSGNLSIRPSGTATASVAAASTLNVGSLTRGTLGSINNTWGGTGSGAVYIDSTYFAATTGKLSVTNDTRAAASITTPPTASPITYPQTLASSSLSGGVGSPAGGAFTWTNSSTVPNAGTSSQSVTYTPAPGTAGLGSYAPTTGTVSVTVNKRAITVTAAANTKSYDGTTSAAAVPTITSGSLAGTDTASWTETYNNMNAGTGKTLLPAGTVNDGNGGNNYAVTFANNTAGVINAVTVTPHITADSKVYDGTTSATIATRSLTGVIGLDDVSLTGGTATFVNAGVGTGKTVTATGLSLSGAAAGNYQLSSTTATTTADITNTAPSFSATSPASGSYINTTAVGYTLSKDVASGTVTFTQTGGNTDGSSPHVYNFAAPDMTAGSHTITTGMGLVNGAIYTVSFDATDGAGYAAATVSNTNILYDALAASVTLSGPASSSSTNNAQVSYTLSKDIASGKIVYTRASGAADGGSPHTYTLSGSELTSGSHTVTTGLPLVDGAVYTVDIENVVDLEGNTSSVVSNTSVKYDITAVAITGTSPAASSAVATATVSYTLSEQASAGKVTFTNTGGTPDASSPQVYTMSVSDLTMGSHTVDTGLGLVDGGIYTVSFDATDLAGNNATTVSNASVSFDTAAPTLNPVHIASNNADTSEAVVGDIVTVTFTSSEGITTPTVTIAGTAATVTGGPTDWSASHGMVAGDALGAVAFSISSFSDFAGNAGSTVSTVTDSSSVTKIKADPGVTTWPTATSITYGQTLASSTLSGGLASVAGIFDFTTPGTAPNAGTASQSVTFTPTDTANYNTATGSVSVTVNKADPSVTTWPTASAITYGQTLASSTLSGGVVTPAGSFAFTTPSTAPSAGTASQSVTYMPTDMANYNTATGTTSVTVNKVTPTITWGMPADITYGTALSGTQLNASASVPGTFIYTPSAGTVLGAGSGHSLNVDFTPTDSVNYSSASSGVTINVNKATPSVTTWPTATAITYGQNLSSSVLSGGSASPAGSFAFTTPATIPNAGTYSASVTFTPTDTTNYYTVPGSVNVAVAKATPGVTTWPTASGITYGQTLANSALSGGSASTGGTFAFTTPATAPSAGTAAQGVTFTPTDATNYNTVAGTVSVTVNKATPTVTTWPTATAITYGQTLASSTLSGGVATPSGSFTFTTPSLAPNAGTASQGVTYTPSDTTNYNAATGSVSVTVNKVTPTIGWSTPADITYGTALGGTQLNATASVPGTFTYTPSSGTVLTAGSGQILSVDFTPTDTSNYNGASKTVTINVIETTGPNLSVSTLLDGSWTSNATLNISGTASDAGSGLQSVTVNGDAVTVTEGAYSAAVTLALGGNTIAVVATDNAGNTTTDTRTIYYDPNVPVITITSPVDNSVTNISAVTISGSVDANSTVTGVTNNGNAVAFTFNSGEGTFSADVTLSYDINTLQVNAKDLADNTASAARTVTFDNLNPSLAVTDPSEDIMTNQSTKTIRGTVADLTIAVVTMTVDSGDPVTLPVTDGSFSGDVTFTAEKAYHIAVTATDEAGNYSTVTRNIIYDALDHITISPASAAINAGESQAYTAEAFDAYDNSLGDVTSSTTFSVSPDGSCTGRSCTASVVGAHTVRGVYDGKTSPYASLQVNVGRLDHFVISATGTQTVGVPFSITITAKDAAGSTVTGFAGTAQLSITAGSLINPVTTGNFIGGVWTGNVTVMAAGTGRQITATKSGGTETGASNSFDVNQVAASFFWSPDPAVSYKVNFNGNGSVCPTGYACTYSWNFGDGATAGNVSTVSHTYTGAGPFLATLTFGSGTTFTDKTTQSVTPNSVNVAPTVARTGVDPNMKLTVAGMTVSFIDASTDDAALPASAVTVSWGDNVVESRNAGSGFSHTYASAGTYSIKQTVTDAGGLMSRWQYTSGPLTGQDAKVTVPTSTTKYMVSGVITDTGSAAVQGATVVLKKNGVTTATTTTNASGAYSFTGLNAATYTVTATLSGYDWQATMGTQTLSLPVTANVTTADVTVNFNPAKSPLTLP